MKAPIIRVLRAGVRVRYRKVKAQLRNIESTLVAIRAEELELLLPEEHPWRTYFAHRRLFRSQLASFWEFQSEKSRVRATQFWIWVTPDIRAHVDPKWPDCAIRGAVLGAVREACGCEHDRMMRIAETCLRYYRSHFRDRRRVPVPNRTADAVYVAAQKTAKHRRIKSRWVLTDRGPQYMTKEVTKR